MVVFAPWWGWALAAVALFVAVRPRRPPGRARRSRRSAELPAQVQPPDQDVITRALGSVGIAEINQAHRATGEFAPDFPSPVREDGPGWRAEVDLPYGVTATQVIDRREQLASGLRRPLGAVWPEPVSPRARRAPGAVGRPGGHLQGQAAAVAVAAVRRRPTCSPRAVRRRRPRRAASGRRGRAQLAGRLHARGRARPPRSAC